jgi:AcrR family transcriptional regulator
MTSAPELDASSLDDARRPGRPRSSEADRAILLATIQLFGEKGIDALTVDEVAARAGVSKATIYRRYPSKAELVVSACEFFCAEKIVTPDTGDLRADLRAMLRNRADLMEDEDLGAAKRMMIADAHRDEQLHAMQSEFVASRRVAGIARLVKARYLGQLRADIDVEIAADVLAAPLFYRFLVSGEPLDDAYIDAVVDAFLRAYGV